MKRPVLVSPAGKPQFADSLDQEPVGFGLTNIGNVVVGQEPVPVSPRWEGRFFEKAISVVYNGLHRAISRAGNCLERVLAHC